jgi:hypothetical protein
MKNPLDRQSGEVPSHTLDLKRLDYVFNYLLNGEGKDKLQKDAWQFSFVRALNDEFKKRGAAAISENALIRLEKIYCRC